MTDKEIKKLLKKNYSYGLNIALRNLVKEINIYNNHISGVRAWDKSKNSFSTERIQVGGGSHYLDGFLNVDISPPADLVFDVRESLPLDDECSIYIFSEHFLEHLDYPNSSKKFINDCFRILKNGGEIVVGVPDSNLILNKYISNDKSFYNEMIDRWYKNRDCLEHFNTYIDLVNYNLRDQYDDAKYNPHYWGYDFEKLKSLMEDAGFINVKKWNFDKTIANPKREWGSVYVIAEKP